MGKRKGRGAAGNAPLTKPYSVQEGPKDTSGSFSTAAPKKSQIGSTLSPMPPPPPVPKWNEGPASSNTVARVLSDSKERGKNPKENPDSPLPLICTGRLLMGTAQCPHFRHLRKYTGIVRGQLESAWDRAFIVTANQIHGLKLEDFWVNSKELWKATADLQTMGYNLIPLRRRLLETRDLMLDMENDMRKILSFKRMAARVQKEMNKLHERIQEMEELQGRARNDVKTARKEAEKWEDELPKYTGLMSDKAKMPFDP